MTDYVKNTDYAAKDNLLTGNPAKLVKGAELDTEFNDIVTAIATKADSADIANMLETADIGVTVQAYDATILVDADIGVSVAAQAHTHSGVYEPADATILKSANIGVSVQGYDADTAKYDDATANFTGNLQNAGAKVLTVGVETVWIPAVAMMSRTTSGAASGTVETSTNKVMVKTLDFDAATDEFAQFAIRMPKSWNESTVTATFLWSSNVAGTNAVVWGIQGVALSDDDALDAAFGTAQTVTDAQTAQGDLMQTAAISAMTIAGTPAANDWVVFQVYRDADNGSDTLAGDARLHGVTLLYTTDAATDA